MNNFVEPACSMGCNGGEWLMLVVVRYARGARQIIGRVLRERDGLQRLADLLSRFGLKWLR
jgi:hypothetical protein